MRLILPLGAKGFGLAVITDILAGPLQGDLATVRKTGDRASSQPLPGGHFFLAIDIAALTYPKAFAEEVDAQIRAIRAPSRSRLRTGVPAGRDRVAPQPGTPTARDPGASGSVALADLDRSGTGRQSPLVLILRRATG